MEKEFEALEFGKWYPIEEYYKRVDEMDWALVQFKEIKTGFMPLPYRAEYIKRYGVWKTETDADRYLCELCEPVAFMLWQPYEQALTELEQIKESKPSEAMERLDYIEYKLGNLRLECEKHHNHRCDDLFIQKHIFTTIKQALLKQLSGSQYTNIYIDEAVNPNEVMKAVEDIYRNGVFLDLNGQPRKYSWETNKSFSEQITLVKQYILKAQELEKELADVEKVKSGKIIIYFGKDLVMMNKNKYYDYLELEKEPISKRILQAKCEELEKENTELKQHIKRWHDLLLKTGINSKGTVVDEIENYWQIKVEAKNER